jgi:hypothetical protein
VWVSGPILHKKYEDYDTFSDQHYHHGCHVIDGPLISLKMWGKVLEEKQDIATTLHLIRDTIDDRKMSQQSFKNKNVMFTIFLFVCE